MRVLITATSSMPDAMGGSDRVIWELARGLAARGHDVRLVVRRLAEGLTPTAVVDGVTIHRYADPWHSMAVGYVPSIVRAARALRAATRDWPADIVHAHHGISGLAASRAGARGRVHTFYGPWHQEFLHEVQNRREMPVLKRWTRGVWAPAKATVARCIERAAVRGADRVVVLSRYSERQLAEIHGVRPPRVKVIPGGVDVQRFTPAPSRAEARRRLGVPEGAPWLFTVRRLVPRMGLEPLLEAIARIPDVRLVVGGTGWLRARLEARVAELGLRDRVSFTGFIDDADLPGFYQAADLVVLPSVALEGFGLIAVEAFACGTPVVATANSGATDILEPLEPSWIAPDATPEALAATITAVLATSGSAEVAKRCRAHAERYSWERMVVRHEELYREVAGGRS